MGFWSWAKKTKGMVDLAGTLVYAEDAIKLADPARFIKFCQEHDFPEPDPAETFMLLAYSVAHLITFQDQFQNDPKFRQRFLAAYDHLVTKQLTERFGSDHHRERFREYKASGLFVKVFMMASQQDLGSTSEAEQQAIIEETTRMITPHLFHSLDRGTPTSFVGVAYFAFLTHVTKHLMDNKGP